jgi:hypothetical protein
MVDVRRERARGKAALDRLYRGHRATGPGLLFLDFDDVICMNSPYGGYDLFDSSERPADLYERLWHPPAVNALLSVLAEHQPRIVITTSWLRLMERAGFETLFRRTGLSAVADALHDAWEAPAMRDMTRHGAIEGWLHAHYAGEPLAILDDDLSGTGLKGSKLDKLGCVVWCEREVGLHAGHLPQVRRALTGVTR